MNYNDLFCTTESVSYIGHSQGTSQMFALLSSKPHFSQVINLFIAMAPIVYMNHVNMILRGLAALFADLLR